MAKVHITQQTGREPKKVENSLICEECSLLGFLSDWSRANKLQEMPLWVVPSDIHVKYIDWAKERRYKVASLQQLGKMMSSLQLHKDRTRDGSRYFVDFQKLLSKSLIARMKHDQKHRSLPKPSKKEKEREQLVRFSEFLRAKQKSLQSTRSYHDRNDEADLHIAVAGVMHQWLDEFLGASK